MWRILLLALMASVSSAFAQKLNSIEFLGLNQLDALTRKVPHLVARRDLAIGDWKMMKTESAHTSEFTHNTRTRIEIIDISDTEITLRLSSQPGRLKHNSSERIQPRRPEFTEEYLRWQFARMDQRLNKHQKILRVRIKQAEYLGQEEQKLAGKKLQCDKVQLSYEFDYQSFRAPTAQLGTGGARITVWYHESIPIDGVVRRETNGSTSILSDYGRRQEGP